MKTELISRCAEDFQKANFHCAPNFLTRFVAALLSKRFVILTGLAGSGKTKVAQCMARWATPTVEYSSPFAPGMAIGSSYRVMDADRISVEFWNKKDEKVVLPRGLIEEWADFLDNHPELADLPSQEMREKFLEIYEQREGSKFARHAILWDTHLKPAALALLSFRKAARAQARCYEIVAVGADWTSTENILGYPDGLDKTRYVRTRSLELILRAEAHPAVPYFLILDEMNLSHVERYFADLLSSIESGEPVHLHSDKDEAGFPAIRDGVPGEVRLPPNLFIIGTVNVDETTYMFSPKVLDRANVLEFRVSAPDLKTFLEHPEGIDFRKLEGAGARFGKEFVALASHGRELPETERRMLKAELLLFFESLQSANAEFGFRVAKEGAAFVHSHRLISGQSWEFKNAMDALILQKLLPKLHGARNTLEPVLWTLATLCFSTRTWDFDERTQQFSFVEELRSQAAKAMRMEDDSFDPLGLKADGQPAYPPENAYYLLSFEKILRMLARLRAKGFTSFAEA